MIKQKQGSEVLPIQRCSGFLPGRLLLLKPPVVSSFQKHLFLHVAIFAFVESLQFFFDALFGHVLVPIHFWLVQATHFGLLVDGVDKVAEAAARRSQGMVTKHNFIVNFIALLQIIARDKIYTKWHWTFKTKALNKDYTALLQYFIDTLMEYKLDTI